MRLGCTLAVAGAAIVIPVIGWPLSPPLLARAAVQVESGPFSVTLDYNAPAGCPSADEFRAVVVGRLGYAPFRDGSSYRVSATIAPDSRALIGRIEWRDADGDWVGDQTFASRTRDCSELARGMGFALAVQIQILATPAAPPRIAPAPAPPAPALPSAGAAAAPTVGSAPAPATSTPAPVSASATAEQTEVVPESVTAEQAETTLAVTAPRPSAPAIWSLGAGTSLGQGLSSSFVGLGRLFGGVGWSHVSLELGAEVSLPATTRREDGAGFAQQLVLLQGAACGDTDRVSGCVLAKGGQLRVEARDVDVPASPRGTFFAVGLRAVVRQQLGWRASLQGRVEGLALLAPWDVTIDRTTVWSSSRFAGMLGLDVVVRFR